MSNINTTKQAFLKYLKVDNKYDAILMSIKVSLQHNKTYVENVSNKDRAMFRNAYASEVMKVAKMYNRSVSDVEHISNMRTIKSVIESGYSDLLFGGELKVGTIQKSLNLYLKYLWCLEEITVPPHCPIDSLILEQIKVYDSWTKLNSFKTYMEWVMKLRNLSKSLGYSSIQDWECEVWNMKFCSLSL